MCTHAEKSHNGRIVFWRSQTILCKYSKEKRRLPSTMRTSNPLRCLWKRALLQRRTSNWGLRRRTLRRPERRVRKRRRSPKRTSLRIALLCFFGTYWKAPPVWRWLPPTQAPGKRAKRGWVSSDCRGPWRLCWRGWGDWSTLRSNAGRWQWLRGWDSGTSAFQSRETFSPKLGPAVQPTGRLPSTQGQQVWRQSTLRKRLRGLKLRLKRQGIWRCWLWCRCCQRKPTKKGCF